MKPETPHLTVDALIFRGDKLVLIKRKNPPFRGMWALPGGFVDVGETVEDACIREAREETGLAVKLQDLVGVYSQPDRDPRGHTVSIAYKCTIDSGELEAADDAAEAGYFKLNKLPSLAFDHREIINDALKLI